jgi:alanine-glyoxylate transaminase/serine-glyoxylate transaminase/serine-pyruvate transaminase
MAGGKEHAGRPGEVVGDVAAPKGPSGVLDVPKRTLMGPGPSNAHPRVLAAQSEFTDFH